MIHKALILLASFCFLFPTKGVSKELHALISADTVSSIRSASLQDVRKVREHITEISKSNRHEAACKGAY